MARHTVDLGTLTIPTGQTNSNVLSLKMGFGYMVDLIIHSPAVLTETSQVCVGPSEGMAASACTPLVVGGDEIDIIAGRATSVPAAAFKSLCVRAAGAEGADRVFRVIGQADMA